MKAAAVKKLALALPETTEEDHHGFPSFRVAKKIFATLPDGEHLNIMLSADEIDMAVTTDPDACEELWWGKKLAGVRVTLANVDPKLVAALLREAWRQRAPARLRSKRARRAR